MSESAKSALAGLQGNITLFAVTIAVAATMVILSSRYSDNVRKETLAAMMSAKQQEQTARQLHSDEQGLREQIARYRSLEAQGVIGNEKRLEWVELLAKLQEENKLFPLDYEFMPQTRVLGAQLPLPSGGHDVFSTSMRLTLPMLHEQDLFRLLAEIQGRAPAMVRARECLIRLPATREERGLSPQLEAVCQLDWLTFKPTPGGAS